MNFSTDITPALNSKVRFEDVDFSLMLVDALCSGGWVRALEKFKFGCVIFTQWPTIPTTLGFYLKIQYVFKF